MQGWFSVISGDAVVSEGVEAVSRDVGPPSESVCEDRVFFLSRTASGTNFSGLSPLAAGSGKKVLLCRVIRQIRSLRR